MTISDSIRCRSALVISVGTGIIITRSATDARRRDPRAGDGLPKTLGLVAVAAR
jgi:hypothetical protein